MLTILLLGTVLNVYTNNVVVKRADTTITPTIGMKLMDTDTVIVKDSSKAEILYADSTVLYLDENTTISTSGTKKRSVFLSFGRIWAKVKNPDGKTTHSITMKNYFIIHGFETKSLRTSDYTELKYFLYKGYPLIAFVTSRKHPGSGHYIVLTGYKEKGFKIIDPEFGYTESLTYKKFKRLHSKRVGPGPYWTLVICPRK